MLIDKLLERFDPADTLPIDVNAIRDALIEFGVQDEIEFHFVSMDSERIRALLHRYTYHLVPYGDPVFHSDIILAQDQNGEDEAWQRVGAVKELLHITDCATITAESEQAVNKLFRHLSLPTELRTPDVNTGPALNDRMRIFLALALLVPKTCREKLRELEASGHLSVKEVALLAKIPQRYGEVVISEDFQTTIDLFVSWESSKNGR